MSVWLIVIYGKIDLTVVAEEELMGEGGQGKRQKDRISARETDQKYLF